MPEILEKVKQQEVYVYPPLTLHQTEVAIQIISDAVEFSDGISMGQKEDAPDIINVLQSALLPF